MDTLQYKLRFYHRCRSPAACDLHSIARFQVEGGVIESSCGQPVIVVLTRRAPGGGGMHERVAFQQGQQGLFAIKTVVVPADRMPDYLSLPLLEQPRLKDEHGANLIRGPDVSPDGCIYATPFESIGIAHIDNFCLGAYHSQQAAGDLPQPGPTNVAAERRSSHGPGAPEPRVSGALAGSGTGEVPARPRRRSVRRSSHKDVDMGRASSSAEPSAMTTDANEMGQLPPPHPPPPPPPLPPLPGDGGLDGAGAGAGGMDASMSEAGLEPMDSAPHEPRQSESAGSLAGQQPRSKDLCIMVQLLKRRQDQSGGWDVFRIPHLVSRPFQVLPPSYFHAQQASMARRVSSGSAQWLQPVHRRAGSGSSAMGAPSGSGDGGWRQQQQQQQPSLVATVSTGALQGAAGSPTMERQSSGGLGSGPLRGLRPRRRSCLSKDSHPGDSAHPASPLPPGSFTLGPSSSRGLAPGHAGEVHNAAGGTVPVKAEATGAMPGLAPAGLQPNPTGGGPGWEAGAPGVGPGGGPYGHTGGQIFSLLDQNYALQELLDELESQPLIVDELTELEGPQKRVRCSLASGSITSVAAFMSDPSSSSLGLLTPSSTSSLSAGLAAGLGLPQGYMQQQLEAFMSARGSSSSGGPAMLHRRNSGFSASITGASGALAGLSGSVAGASGSLAGLSGSVAGASGTLSGYFGPVTGLSGSAAGASGSLAGLPGPVAGQLGQGQGPTGRNPVLGLPQGGGPVHRASAGEMLISPRVSMQGLGQGPAAVAGSLMGSPGLRVNMPGSQSILAQRTLQGQASARGLSSDPGQAAGMRRSSAGGPGPVMASLMMGAAGLQQGPASSGGGPTGSGRSYGSGAPAATTSTGTTTATATAATGAMLSSASASASQLDTIVQALGQPGAIQDALDRMEQELFREQHHHQQQQSALAAQEQQAPRSSSGAESMQM